MNGNMNNNNEVCPRVKSKVNIRDAKEIMEHIWNIESIVSENSDNMKECVYLDLMNSLMNMAMGEFYMELDTTARKTLKKQYTRIKAENMRRFAIQHPDKACICDRCDTPLMKKSLAKHLKSKECKDKAYLIMASGGSIGNKNTLNEKVVEKYEEDAPLPEVELTAENYFIPNMFDSPY